MSRGGDIALQFGGEERTFRLALGQWRKVQEKCDAGPAELLARLAPMFAARQQGLKVSQMLTHGLLGTWRVDDVREVILQGLLGGEMPGPAAFELVKAWVDERPIFENVELAYQIVMASVFGAEDEKPVGESLAAAAASPRSRRASSGSAKTATTPSAPPAASPPTPSIA
jgi:hypothetical protein